MNIFDIEVKTNDHTTVKMETYKGNVLLIVNTATKCGFSYQLNQLQSLYEKYQDKGLMVLAFPSNQFANQEPGTDEEIKQILTEKYGVTFPVFEKLEVNGDNAHPLFQFLKNEKSGIMGTDIKWNFTKFLVDRNGKVVGRYTPKRDPEKIESKILSLLDKE